MSTSTLKRDQTVAEALLDHGLVDRAVIGRALSVAAEGGVDLQRVLLELGVLEDTAFAAFLAEWLDLPLVGPDAFEPLEKPEITAAREAMRKFEVAPVALQDGHMLVAMADPLNVELAESLAFRLGLPVRRAVATRQTLERVYASWSIDGQEDVDVAAAAAGEHDIERLRSLANDGPVVRLVAEIIAAAADSGASDIHFEAHDGAIVIRLRVDGRLRRYRTLSGDNQSAVVSRLKIMASLNISERRRPQDGRIRVAVRGRNVDLRLSTVPTQFGESIVLRVLDRARQQLDWNALGFAPTLAARIEHLTSRPHGLFLVTGPTGSGKTTTLYTALSRLNAEELKIFSVEDPIEYTLQGVNQVQVRPELDLSFAAALRAILRQDFNVVMVGEIRDRETAENAVRAALMGRMVLSTVHTNSALGAVDRLIDLGVPPFLLGATLHGVLSQRLVRRLCADCAVPESLSTIQRFAGVRASCDDAGLPDLSAALRPEASGCESCGGAGYRGRVVVPELVEFDEALAVAVSRGDSAQRLAEVCAQGGGSGLRDAALGLVALGQTSLAEAHSILGWT